MSIKGTVTGITGVGLAAAGTVYAMGKLSGMSSDEIRQKGEHALDTLQNVGSKLASTGIAQDINKKMDEYPFTKSLGKILGKGVSGTMHGFDKFIDVVSDAKAKTERDGTDFSSNLASGIGAGLKGAVASVGTFVTEKLGEIATPDAGTSTHVPEPAVVNDGPYMDL